MYSTRGFTVWEIVIVITIVAILAQITIPGLAVLTQQKRSDVIAIQLDDTIRFARNEALRLNKSIMVCPISHWRGTYRCAANNRDWSRGLMVFMDVNNDGLYNTDELLKITRFESSSLATAVVSSNSMRYTINADSTLSPTNNGYVCFKLDQLINNHNYISYAMFNSYGNMTYCRSPKDLQSSECALCR